MDGYGNQAAFFYAERPRMHTMRDSPNVRETWTNPNYSLFMLESVENAYEVADWRKSLVSRKFLESKTRMNC